MARCQGTADAVGSYNPRIWTYTLAGRAAYAAGDLMMASFPAVTQRNAEANAGEQFDKKFGGRSAFTETFNYFPNLSGPSGYRYNFNSILSTAISRWLAWQLSWADNFLGNPPTGIKRNDLLLSTGLLLTFSSRK